MKVLDNNINTLVQNCLHTIYKGTHLSKEALFDEFTKILFMLVCEKQNPDKGLRFSQAQDWFAFTKTYFEKYQLFSAEDTININQNILNQIIQVLSDAQVVENDNVAIMFENALNQSFTESLAQFTTPTEIATYIVDILDPKNGELICDLCSGVGNILTAVLNNLKKQEGSNERIFSTIYGVEINPRIAYISRRRLFLQNYKTYNITHKDSLDKNKDDVNTKYDVICVNPPWGVKTQNKPLELQFLQKALDLLVPGGRMAIILPEMFFFKYTI